MTDLLKVDNLVNMDSRTVLSCVRYPAGGFGQAGLSDFAEAVYRSATARESEGENDLDVVLNWITYLKVRYELEVRRIPLNETTGWRLGEAALRHESGRFFQVIAVAVKAGNREVTSWKQPLIESMKGGVLCFLCQRRKGLLHFLVQGRVEPGHFDSLELAPTLQCTPRNYDPARLELLPPFYHEVFNARPDQVRYSTTQSEEGGRFYHDENRYLIVELDAGEEPALPENFAWMTLRQMKEILRFNNYFNIEARGLMAVMASGVA
jgi:oxidase EvaA